MSTNIVWYDFNIDRAFRERFKGHKSRVIWLTGLSASGKSTIASELEKSLFKRGVEVYILDGDNIRHGLNKDLGFTPEDRKENIRRIGEVVKLFLDSGSVVITSFISPYREDRDFVRNILNEGDFIEVYVKCPVEECINRDPKGLYKKALNGEIPEFTGISAPYEEPLNPEIVVETDKMSVSECVQEILDYIEDKI